MTSFTPRNLGALVRWLGWRARYRNLEGGIFFCGRGSTITIKNGARLQIGANFVALNNFHAVLLGRVRIGKNVFFNEGCHLSVVESLVIGDGCMFGEKVSIHDEDHKFGPEYVATPLVDRGMTTAPIVIEDDVWVGAKVSILGGCRIGKGAVVGAHSVVTRDVPERSLVLGSPARVIRSW